ncbi:MAG TPA: hypothetical protein VGN53_10625, partial [Klebsiella sp.]
SSMSLALTGRRKRRSSLFQTDLSVTRITYLNKLIGMNEGHPCPSPEVTFGCASSFLTNLSLPLPRDSAFGLTPSGPAQALFKTINRFVLQLESFRVY